MQEGGVTSLVKVVSVLIEAVPELMEGFSELEGFELAKTVLGRVFLVSTAEGSQGTSPARRKPLMMILGLVRTSSTASLRSGTTVYLVREVGLRCCHSVTFRLSLSFRLFITVRSRGCVRCVVLGLNNQGCMPWALQYSAMARLIREMLHP